MSACSAVRVSASQTILVFRAIGRNCRISNTLLWQLHHPDELSYPSCCFIAAVRHCSIHSVIVTYFCSLGIQLCCDDAIHCTPLQRHHRPSSFHSMHAVTSAAIVPSADAFKHHGRYHLVSHVSCSGCCQIYGKSAGQSSSACWLSLHLRGKSGCSAPELPHLLLFVVVTSCSHTCRPLLQFHCSYSVGL